MQTMSHLFRRLYGERVLHLIILLAALALAAYAVSVLGLKGLYNPRVWWQSIGVWFAVAVIGHDLVLFPLYTPNASSDTRFEALLMRSPWPDWLEIGRASCRERVYGLV